MLLQVPFVQYSSSIVIQSFRIFFQTQAEQHQICGKHERIHGWQPAVFAFDIYDAGAAATFLQVRHRPPGPVPEQRG